MRFFGLIGKTLEHSFSPVFFKEKFDDEGITDCFYNLYPLKNINEFKQLITDFSDLSGLNVTIPYKQEIIPFLDEINKDAQKIGAVNTIKFDRDGSKLKLSGYNTDYLGFMDSLKPLLKKQHKSALVFGTGGSSMAVAHALKKLGLEFKKVSRNPKQTNEISYKQLTPDIVMDNKLIINTTPLGMYPDILKNPQIPYEELTKDHLLYDLIYNPQQTDFLAKGKKHGAVTKNGFEMLLLQAEYSWKIWNNYSF